MIKIKYLLVMVSLVAGLAGTNAQENDTPDLVTDRPDQTESAETVYKGGLQIETGGKYGVENDFTTKVISNTYNSTLIRYGLTSFFELRFGVEYLHKKHITPLEELYMGFVNSSTSLHEDLQVDGENVIAIAEGFAPLLLGYKVRLLEQKNILPQTAILGHFNIGKTGSGDFKSQYLTGDMILALAWDLSDRFSLGANGGVNWQDNTDLLVSIKYAVALGIGITDRFGAFAEVFGEKEDGVDGAHSVDAGYTFLIRDNLQADISGGLGLSDMAMDGFIGLGLSWRIPK